ncbi:MAG TPA: extracellular solute-binding protein [Acetobacteraceae bacterium]|nr:extracellular solute-binding protein [Acetobacteraceae bacterium]
MSRASSWTRRHILGASAGAAALAIGARHGALAAPAVQKGSTLTYWGGLIFSDQANKTLTDAINKWGADHGVRTEVVMINQNDTVQKVSAAIASGTMPDALDVGLDLLIVLARQGVFLPVDDTYNAIGKDHGGWLPPVDKASNLNGGRFGIPFGISGNMLLRRNDVLSKAGFPNAPTTWAELVTQSEKIVKPPFFPMGFCLGNAGDGNTQVNVLQSYGGRIADDSGKEAAIKSDATRAYLTWLKDAYDKKLFPPGVTAWDGAGDNNAYAAGTIAFAANTGSVGIAARKDDPDLYQGTLYSALPGGPKGVISPIGPQLRSIPKTSKNPDGAKALFEYLAQPGYTGAYYANAIYGPVLANEEQLSVFGGKDPILAGLLDLVKKGTAPGFPDVYNAAYADVMNSFLIPKMIQRVVVDHWDFDRAMDETQAQIQATYNKYT